MVTVRSLTCASCGGRATIPRGAMESVCAHCGEPVRRSDAMMQEQRAQAQFPPTTPLRPGMKAFYQGREFEATGRLVLRQVTSEGVWTWEEWLLVSPEGQVLYLEFDEGKWTISEAFTPSNPPSLQHLQAMGEGRILNLEGIRAPVTDAGEYVVIHAEGEFPWVVTPGRPVRFCDVESGPATWSIEWTEDAIEYYRGRRLDYRQVLAMFDLREEMAALEARERVLAGRRRGGLLVVALSLVSLAVWAVAMSSGRPVAGGTGEVQLQRVGVDGARFGPVQLRQVNRVHRLQVTGTLRESSVWIGAVLEDEQQQELVTVDRDMWDESGYDSDGYWHESDLHASTDFVLRKPGAYYVRVYAEPEPGRPMPAAVARFRLLEGAIFPWYVGLYGLLGTIVGVGLLASGSPAQVATIGRKLREASEDGDGDD